MTEAPPIGPAYIPPLYANVVGFPYIDIVRDRFSYSLGVDRWNFGTWAEKVMETENYVVDAFDAAAAYRFSPFLITHHCNTDANVRGCCMISESKGGVCLLSDELGDEMNTYRFNSIEWLGILSKFTATQ